MVCQSMPEKSPILWVWGSSKGILQQFRGQLADQEWLTNHRVSCGPYATSESGRAALRECRNVLEA